MTKHENRDDDKSEEREAPEVESAKAEQPKTVERTGHTSKDHEKDPALSVEGDSRPIDASDWIAHEKKIHEGESDQSRPHSGDAKKSAPVDAKKSAPSDAKKRSHHSKSEGRAPHRKEK